MLLSTMHHIISDGWSLEVMGRELSALYEAYEAREKFAIAGVADSVCGLCGVATRVVARRSAGETTRLLARSSWEENCRSWSCRSTVPRPARQSYRGAAEGIQVSTEVSRRLKETRRDSTARRCS